MSENSEDFTYEVVASYRTGARCTPDQSKALETELRLDPPNLKLRCRLLGFYRNRESDHGTECWVGHAKWLICNYTSEKFMSMIIRPPKGISKRQMSLICREWEKAAGQRPNEPDAFGNAAIFHSLSNSESAELLFKKAKRLAPNDFRWTKGLIHLYLKRLRSSRGEKWKKVATQIFREGDSFVKRFQNIPHHVYPLFEILTLLCNLALEANNLKRASRYIEEIKTLTDDFAGTARNESYLLKGRLALKKGELKEAKGHLLKAGKLGFSRDMTLARELKDAGELKVVIRYLQLCLKVEDLKKDDQALLSIWLEDLARGQDAKLIFEKEGSFSIES